MPAPKRALPMMVGCILNFPWGVVSKNYALAAATTERRRAVRGGVQQTPLHEGHRISPLTG